jgi:hypothetical protein
MKRNGWILFCVAVVGLVSLLPVDALSAVLRGRVLWANGTPAMGFEVKIVQASKDVAMAMTNENGLYAFFNITSPLKDFQVVVSDYHGVVARIRVNSVPADGRLPDITVR